MKNKKTYTEQEINLEIRNTIDGKLNLPYGEWVYSKIFLNAIDSSNKDIKHQAYSISFSLTNASDNDRYEFFIKNYWYDEYYEDKEIVVYDSILKVMEVWMQEFHNYINDKFSNVIAADEEDNLDDLDGISYGRDFIIDDDDNWVWVERNFDYYNDETLNPERYEHDEEEYDDHEKTIYMRTFTIKSNLEDRSYIRSEKLIEITKDGEKVIPF